MTEITPKPAGSQPIAIGIHPAKADNSAIMALFGTLFAQIPLKATDGETAPTMPDATDMPGTAPASQTVANTDAPPSSVLAVLPVLPFIPEDIRSEADSASIPQPTSPALPSAEQSTAAPTNSISGKIIATALASEPPADTQPVDAEMTAAPENIPTGLPEGRMAAPSGAAEKTVLPLQSQPGQPQTWQPQSALPRPQQPVMRAEQHSPTETDPSIAALAVAKARKNYGGRKLSASRLMETAKALLQTKTTPKTQNSIPAPDRPLPQPATEAPIHTGTATPTVRTAPISIMVSASHNTAAAGGEPAMQEKRPNNSPMTAKTPASNPADIVKPASTNQAARPAAGVQQAEQQPSLQIKSDLGAEQAEARQPLMTGDKPGHETAGRTSIEVRATAEKPAAAPRATLVTEATDAMEMPDKQIRDAALQAPRPTATGPRSEGQLQNQTSHAGIVETTGEQAGGDDAGNRGQQDSARNASQPASRTLEQQLMLDTRQKNWDQQLVRQISQALRNGEQNLKLVLEPRSLGRLQLNIIMRADQPHIQIGTETLAASAMLLETEARLSQMMEQAGMRLGSLNTSSAEADRQGGGNQQHENQQNGTQQGTAGNKDGSGTDDQRRRKKPANNRDAANDPATTDTVSAENTNKPVLNMLA